MIVDKLENWNHYHFGPGWKRASEFLLSLTPDSEEKKYPIQNDEIYALVMGYKTQIPETTKLETHRKYIDIQTLLIGRERIEWFPRAGLGIDVPYDESKDAEFYKRLHPGPVSIDLVPGIFVMLFPHDAHMPSLTIGEKSESVKKVVIKMDVGLLTRP